MKFKFHWASYSFIWQHYYKIMLAFCDKLINPNLSILLRSLWQNLIMKETLTEKYEQWTFLFGLIAQYVWGNSVQFSSVAESCLILCNPMDCSTPAVPVHWQLLEFTQTHAHWVDGVIQQFHLLLSPSSTAFNLSQH